MLRRFSILFVVFLHVTAAGQRKDGPGGGQTGMPDQGASAPAAKVSDAERITRLRTSISENQNLLGELQAQIDEPDTEYSRAEQEFQELDETLKAKEKDVTRRKSEGEGDSAGAENELQILRRQWQLAKDRFDLAIQERRALQNQISTLSQKIEQDKAALQKLVAPPETAPAGEPSPKAKSDVAKPSTGAEPDDGEPAEAIKQKVIEAAPLPINSTPESQDKAAASTTGPGGESKAPATDEKLSQAKEQAAAKATEAAEAEAQVRSLDERIVALKKLIESERKLLETARRKSQNARETERALTDDVQQLAAEGASQGKIQETWAKVRDARKRLGDSHDEVQRRGDRIDELQDDLVALQAERIAALEDVQQKQEEAEKAKEQVARIENPLSGENLLKWIVEHGPPIAAIVAGALILLALVRFADRRFVNLIAERTARGSPAEREYRARTLVAVFHNAANVIIIVGALFMMIAEVGINIAPLMGGAAVVGLAVAFGAQNLIRDFFTGFIILLENQYTVQDVVKIGDNAGLVERITLRLTVLRDLEGIVHFIPNGEVKTVRNLTHGWSRALFEIGVAYKENVDDVMRVLMELAEELCQDRDFRHKVLDKPEMLGVDALGDSAVLIKFMIKTRPLEQWAVKRELLRRIKNRFDEVGIEIPFPHRSVYHRSADGSDLLEHLSRQS